VQGDKMEQYKPQTHPGQQIPDHRFDELQSQMRKLEMQNQQLRGHIDAMTQRQATQAPQEEENGFKPEVAQQLEKFIKRHVEPLQAELKNSLGLLYDSQDEVRFQQSYNGDRWAKYKPKVEQLRQEMQAQGKWVTREQALQMVYFEETGKKPAPEAAKQEAAPKYDPYFNTMVDPATGLPYKGQPAQAPQETEFKTEQAPMSPQQMPWQQPAAQWQQPQQAKQELPYGNKPTQKFGLPDQGVNSAFAPEHQAPRAPRELTIDASDAELDAFEKTMGDIPF
jgi:hypothetical protein